MLLSLEEACEVLDSELFQYCGPLRAGEVVVGSSYGLATQSQQ